jgi:hypothetical protein
MNWSRQAWHGIIAEETNDGRMDVSALVALLEKSKCALLRGINCKHLFTPLRVSTGGCRTVRKHPHGAVEIGCFRFLANEQTTIQRGNRKLSGESFWEVPRLVKMGLKRVVVELLCPDGIRRCLSMFHMDRL